MANLLAKGLADGKRSVASYLTECYKLVSHFAKWNKQLYCLAGGRMESLGGALLAASPIPAVRGNATLSFPEASEYGFVPLGGSTYFLSRLPGELGTYLALTGKTLNAGEMIHTHFAEKYVRDEIGIEDFILNIAEANKIIVNKYSHIMQQGTECMTEFKEKLLETKEKKEKNEYYEGLYGASDNEGKLCKINPWIRLERRAKDLLYGSQDADIRMEIKHFEKLMKMWDHYGHISEMARLMMPGTSIEGHPNLLYGIETIRRCFYPDDVEEIKDLLRKDGSEFAIECLNIMEAASPLALALTLRTLREARMRNFPEAMALELGVAINRATDSEFPIAMQNCILSKSSRTGNIWKYLAPIPPSLVDQYFAIPNWVSPTTVNLLKDAFVPVREFRKKFPNTLLTWLNGDPTKSPMANIDFYEKLNLYLEDLGFDVREAALSPENLRKDFKREYDLLRFSEERLNRLTELGLDKKLRNRYFKQRKALLDKMFENEETYYKEIHKRIEEAFEIVRQHLTY